MGWAVARTAGMTWTGLYVKYKFKDMNYATGAWSENAVAMADTLPGLLDSVKSALDDNTVWQVLRSHCAELQ